MRERLRRRVSRAVDLEYMPRSRGDSRNTRLASRFRDIYLATSSCQHCALLVGVRMQRPDNSHRVRERRRRKRRKNGRYVVREAKERKKERDRLVLFRVLIRIIRVCVSYPQDYPFSRSPSVRGPRDAKSLNGFRYRIFRATRFATCKFGVFSARARAEGL